jgi:hypothetical protein
VGDFFFLAYPPTTPKHAIIVGASLSVVLEPTATTNYCRVVRRGSRKLTRS